MIFHLAIPAIDLEESAKFYERICAVRGRVYNTHIVLNLQGHQLVLHKSDISYYAKDPSMYPRHFGVIFSDYDRFNFFYYQVLELHLQQKNQPDLGFPEIRFFEVNNKSFTRHEGEFAEHKTFFLLDPSNNVIEFKAYKNETAIFS